MEPYDVPKTEPGLPPEEAPSHVSRHDNVGCGVLYWLLGLCVSSILLLTLSLLPGADELFLVSLAMISVSQVIFVVPMIIYFKKTMKRQALKGFVATAGIVFLLNGGCLALIFGSM